MDQLTECNHTSEERAITGIFTTNEYELALDHGYRTMEIYEIWSYQNEDRTLFQDFVRLCLKQKAEASGYPEWCKSNEQKEAYVKSYKELYGIELEPDKIIYNPAIRTLAKYLVNSLSGKK